MGLAYTEYTQSRDAPGGHRRGDWIVLIALPSTPHLKPSPVHCRCSKRKQALRRLRSLALPYTGRSDGGDMRTSSPAASSAS